MGLFCFRQNSSADCDALTFKYHKKSLVRMNLQNVNSRVTQIKSCNFKWPKLLETSRFDLSLVKPKCVLGVADFFSVFRYLFTIFSCLFTISKKNLPPLKHILVFTTYGLGSIITEYSHLKLQLLIWVTLYVILIPCW